jgi:transcriptional regulator with XRE-family HTH domain
MSKLKEVRFFKGMNQYQLANLAQVHQSRISLIEKGYAKPTPKEKEGLARALGVKVEDLWGEHGTETNG